MQTSVHNLFSKNKFCKNKFYKKMRLKWPESSDNHVGQFPKVSVFVGQKSILHHYYIQEDGIHIRVGTENKESIYCNIHSQFGLQAI